MIDGVVVINGKIRNARFVALPNQGDHMLINGDVYVVGITEWIEGQNSIDKKIWFNRPAVHLSRFLTTEDKKALKAKNQD